MRRGAALAAATLVTIVAVVASCKPSSLTPFTGTREPETSSGFNGRWQGSTNEGGEVSFSIASNKIGAIMLQHVTETCIKSFGLSELSPAIADNAIVYDNTLESGGKIHIEFTFTSAETCSGSYFFEATAASGSCPISGSGSFTATNIE